MFGTFLRLIPLSLLTIASFSSSTSYNLNSYSIGPGGTNTTSSTTYKGQANLGEQTNQSTSGTTFTLNGGGVKTEQLNTPLAPTLSNGSGSYYNKLLVTINTGILPSDTVYAIAISTNSFVTTNYIQVDGTQNSTPYYQTYTAWGGASGTYMINLAPSTAYQVKIAAKQGLFTNTAYGPSATASTVAPSITFSVSPNTVSLGNLNSGTVITSGSPVTFGYATNAANGGNVYVAGQNGGLKSTKTGYTISALTGNLSVQSEGFGLQGATASQTSGGPFTIAAPYNGTLNNVGTETTTYVPVFSTSAPIIGGSSTLNFLAKSASSDPAAQDYQEILTFIASASF